MNNHSKRDRKYIIFSIILIGLIVFLLRENYLDQIQKNSNDSINENHASGINVPPIDKNKTILQDSIRKEIDNLTVKRENIVETENKYGGKSISLDGKVVNVTVATKDSSGKITIQEYSSSK